MCKRQKGRKKGDNEKSMTTTKHKRKERFKSMRFGRIGGLIAMTCFSCIYFFRFAHRFRLSLVYVHTCVLSPCPSLHFQPPFDGRIISVSTLLSLSLSLSPSSLPISPTQTFLYSYFIFSNKSMSRVSFRKSVSTYRETARIKRAVIGSHQNPMAGKGVYL